MSDSFDDVAEVALLLGEGLERAGVAYFIGGSVASSIHGIPRFTNDIDVVVDLEERQVSGLAKVLGTDFEVDEESLKEATRLRRSWNIFHVPTATKIDLFVRKLDAFDDSRFARRVSMEPAPGRRAFLSSAEDTILRKLLWYREGGESSERQWTDVLDMLDIGATQLDNSYLSSWAARLGITDLLTRARGDRRFV